MIIFKSSLPVLRNTRYTPTYVTYGAQTSNNKARVDLANSPTSAQADKPAGEDLA